MFEAALFIFVCLFVSWLPILWDLPRPGIEPGPPQWKHWILATGPPGNSFFFFFNFIYLFIYGCVGSSFLCEGFLQLRQVGATLHRGAQASHCRGLSCCGAQAPDAQAQQLWLTGLVAPRHVGIFPDQGSNPCPLHWQADSQPLRHQGSPLFFFEAAFLDLVKSRTQTCSVWPIQLFRLVKKSKLLASIWIFIDFI